MVGIFISTNPDVTYFPTLSRCWRSEIGRGHATLAQEIEQEEERATKGRKEDPPRTSAFLRLVLEIIPQRVRRTKRSMVRNRGLIFAKLKLCRAARIFRNTSIIAEN